MEGELIENFIALFKRVRIRCHLNIPEQEFVKLNQGGLSYKLPKKFEGTKLHNLFMFISLAI